VVKNGVGIYGAMAILAIVIGPFLQIGVQYLLLKSTAAVCSIFGTKKITALVQDFAAAMGILLAMTGSCCLLLMISIVCFMKGVG
jgi:stage III sporulation protein AE